MMRRRRGFMLIVALFVIASIGLAMTLLGRHFLWLDQSSRLLAVEARTAALLDSGRAWITLHADEAAALPPGELIELPVSDLVPPDAAARLHITRDEDGVKIAAAIRCGRLERKSTLTLATP